MALSKEENAINAVLREAEKIAVEDRELYSGDIVQFPASIAHAYEKGNPGAASTVVKGKMVPDQIIASAVRDAAEAAMGEGRQALSHFLMALGRTVCDLNLLIAVAEDHLHPINRRGGVPLCPYCKAKLDTVTCDRITREEGVEVEADAEDRNGIFQYCDEGGEGAMGGSIEYENFSCLRCGEQLPPSYQKVFAAS